MEEQLFDILFPRRKLYFLWRRSSLFGTIYAVDVLYPDSAKRMVVKVIKQIAGYDPSVINDVTHAFRNELTEKGVHLSRDYAMHIVDGTAIHISSYEGDDLEELLRRHPRTIDSELPAVVDSIRGVLLQNEPVVGLDPKLSNFGSGGIYLDTFPPLIKYRGEWWIHYPNHADPAAIARDVERKCSPLSLIRKLRFFFTAIQADWYFKFEQQIQPILHGSLEHVRHSLDTLPERLVHNGRMSPTSAIDIIGQCVQADQDVETMRELAAQLAPPQWKERYQFLTETAFRLSSTYGAPGYPPSYDERLARLRQILIGFLAGQTPAL